MNTTWLILALITLALAAPTSIARAQEPDPPTPAWATEILTRTMHIEAQNDQILAALNAGVKLNPIQGPVRFGKIEIISDQDHDGALKIMNNYPGGYAAFLRAGGLGGTALVTEGNYVGFWALGGKIGLVSEGTQINGIKAIGGIDPVYPPWGGAAQCSVDIDALADAVWDEQVIEHLTACTTGAALNGRRCR